MSLSKWIQRNPTSSLILGGLAVSLIFSSGNLRQNAQSIADVRHTVQSNTAMQMQLQASEQANQQRAQIAEARYQQGCILVVALHDPSSFTTISEGQPVIDQARGVPFPIGTIVCDSFGNTGKIIAASDGTPVVGEVAFTGNRAVIDAAMQQIQAQYRSPSQ